MMAQPASQSFAVIKKKILQILSHTLFLLFFVVVDISPKCKFCKWSI